MSEEDFLSRWSRRKREAEVVKTELPDAKADATAKPDDAARAESATEPEPEFDITTLPSIESITSATDVTAFLRKGVPVDLTRAALRRVWTADPAIRDFVGLAENAWDFTDPNAMPGFGPLEDTENVRRMIAQVIDSIGQKPPVARLEQAEVVENSSHSNEIEPVRSEEEASGDRLLSEQQQQIDAQSLSNQVMLQSTIEEAAVQRNLTEAQEKPKQLSRRQHGGALPE